MVKGLLKAEVTSSPCELGPGPLCAMSLWPAMSGCIKETKQAWEILALHQRVTLGRAVTVCISYYLRERKELKPVLGTFHEILLGRMLCDMLG